MDPRSQAEWDLAMLEFRKAIGQERPEDVNLLVSAAYRTSQGLPPAPYSYHGQLAAYSIASAPSPHVHWAMALGGQVTPDAARALMGMQQIAWTPSRWVRLKGTVFRRVRNGRKWLGSKIAGCECDTTW